MEGRRAGRHARRALSRPGPGFTLNGPLPPGDIIINGHFAHQFFAAVVHVA
jgi:hypothetical protein